LTTSRRRHVPAYALKGKAGHEKAIDQILLIDGL